MLEYVMTALELWPIVGKLFKFLNGWIKLNKRNLRLLWNLRRPIMLIGSTSGDLTLVRSLLREAEYFRVEEPANDKCNVDRLRDHSAIIYAYSAQNTDLHHIIDISRGKRVPVIVYAKHSEVTEQDQAIIRDYSFSEIVNSPLRLMNVLLSILSVNKPL